MHLMTQTTVPIFNQFKICLILFNYPTYTMTVIHTYSFYVQYITILMLLSLNFFLIDV